MDVALLRWINGHRTHALDVIVPLLNAWGFFVIPIAVIAAAIIRRNRTIAAHARDVILTWYVGLTFAEDMVKAVIHRPRPTAVPAIRATLHLLGRASSSYSFPSGTATAMFAASTAVWIAFGRRIGIAATLFAALVSLTRVYVGVHYPSDLLGGAVLGACVALGINRLSNWIDRGLHSRPSV